MEAYVKPKAGTVWTLIISLFTFLVITFLSQRHLRFSGRHESINTTKQLICRVLVVEFTLVGESESATQPLFRCETSPEQEPDGRGDITYAIDLPPIFVAQHPHLQNGETYIEIHNGIAVRDHPVMGHSITFTSHTTITAITTIDDQHRQTTEVSLPAAMEGTRIVLVVRVTALDSEVSVSRALISASIFGHGGFTELINLRSQYRACSFGKVDMKPAEGSDIIGGVGEIFLDQNVTGLNTFTLDNRLVELTERKFGSIQAQYKHVVFCLPPGLFLQGSSYIAYALVNHWRSVFNDQWCTKYSAVAHEIGKA